MSARPTRGQLSAALADAIPDADAVAANGHALVDDTPQPQAVNIPYPSGPAYDLMQMVDLCMADAEQFRRLYSRLTELRAAPGDDDGLLTDAQQTQIKEIETRIALLAVPDAPADAVRALSDRRRANLLNAFLEGLGFTKQVQALMQRAFMQQALQEVAKQTTAETNPPITRLRTKSASTTKRSRS